MAKWSGFLSEDTPSFDVEENENEIIHDPSNVDASGNSHAVQWYLVMVA